MQSHTGLHGSGVIIPGPRLLWLDNMGKKRRVSLGEDEELSWLLISEILLNINVKSVKISVPNGQVLLQNVGSGKA